MEERAAAQIVSSLPKNDKVALAIVYGGSRRSKSIRSSELFAAMNSYLLREGREISTASFLDLLARLNTAALVTLERVRRPQSPVDKYRVFPNENLREVVEGDAEISELMKALREI